MPKIDDAIRARKASHTGAWRAKVATTANDPTEEVFVTIPAFDTQLRWGPCRWMPRGDITYPARGDEALVLFDDKKVPWIIAWWPFINPL